MEISDGRWEMTSDLVRGHERAEELLAIASVLMDDAVELVLGRGATSGERVLDEDRASEPERETDGDGDGADEER